MNALQLISGFLPIIAASAEPPPHARRQGNGLNKRGDGTTPAFHAWLASGETSNTDTVA